MLDCTHKVHVRFAQNVQLYYVLLFLEKYFFALMKNITIKSNETIALRIESTPRPPSARI